MKVRDELAVGTHALAPRVNSLVPQAMKSQMPHSGVPLSVFNYPGVRGQVDRPAARSSGQMYTSSWRAAPMDTDATRQRLVVIREYLADHPDQYIPSHEDIKNQKFILVRQTITVVMNLLRSKKPPYAWQRYNALDYKSPPNFYEALLEPNFRQMCKRMYGVGTEKELYKKMDESSLDMTEFLRAFLAATITDWVFKEQVVSMPKVISDRTGPPLVFEKEARKGMLLSLSSLQSFADEHGFL